MVRSYDYYVLFFFSSRRRHPRSLRDWSSDVCSSDLGGGSSARPCSPPAVHLDHEDDADPRSEERRGGKECRSRWSPYHLKKKTELCPLVLSIGLKGGVHYASIKLILLF